MGLYDDPAEAQAALEKVWEGTVPPTMASVHAAQTGINAGANQGLGSMFDFGGGLGAITAITSYGRNREARSKAERQKNENLRLLTLDEMTKAGIDPNDIYSFGKVESTVDPATQAEMGLAQQEMDILNPPQEIAEGYAREQYIKDWRADNQDVMQKAYDDFLGTGLDYSDYKNQLTPAVNSLAAPISNAGTKLGEAWDTTTGVFSKVFQMPGLPDFTVFNPFDPSVKVIWGTPSGSPTIPVGVTPGKDSVSVTTGIPWLDEVWKRVSGSVKDGDWGDITPTAKDVKDILGKVLRGKLGLPESMTIEDIFAEASNRASTDWTKLQEDNKTKLGLDLGFDDDGNPITLDDDEVEATEVIPDPPEPEPEPEPEPDPDPVIDEDPDPDPVIDEEPDPDPVIDEDLAGGVGFPAGGGGIASETTAEDVNIDYYLDMAGSLAKMLEDKAKVKEENKTRGIAAGGYMKKYEEGGVIIPEYTGLRPLRKDAMPTGLASLDAPIMGRQYFQPMQYAAPGTKLADYDYTAEGVLHGNVPEYLGSLRKEKEGFVSNFDPLVNISDPTGGKLADPNYIPQLGDIISGNEFVDTTQSVGTREDGTTYVKTDAVGAGQIPLGLERGIVGKDSIYDPARIATQQIYEGIRGKWGDMNKAGAKQELAKFINGKTTPEAFATAMNMPLADVQAILSDAQTANTPPPLVEYSSAPSGVKPSLNPFTRKPQTNSDGAVLGDDGKYYNADSFAQGGRVGMYNQGGLASFLNRPRGYYLGGTTDGMADNVPATIEGAEPARLSDGEFVLPADVVSHLGNGNSDAGAKNLYGMMDKIRKDRTGTTRQGKQINPNKYLRG